MMYRPSTFVTMLYYAPCMSMIKVLFFGQLGREMYTYDMNQFMNNRYVQLTGLILGLGGIPFIFLLIIINSLQLDIPWFVPFIASFGFSIWFVWKFMAYKIG